MEENVHLLIAHFHPKVVSGAEIFIADFADKRDEHIQITMLIPAEGKLADFFRFRGYPTWVYPIDTKRRLYPGLHTLQSYWLARQMKARSVQTVLCNTFAAAGRVKTACHIAGIPFAIYVREYISDRPVHRRILDQANQVLAESMDVQHYLSAMMDPAKIRVAYDYLNPAPILMRLNEHRSQKNRLAPFGREHPLVGMVGRIAQNKQQDLLVRAIPLVLAEVPQARFVIVGSAIGSEKAYEASVLKLAADLGVQDKVAFMGQRKDAVEITSEFTVSCLTTTREPLGRVILEAQLVGCPVIVADAGGAAETVEDGVTGLKFISTAPDAKEQLARQIVRLLCNPELRCTLAENARQAVMNSFSSEQPVRRLEQYIVELAGKNHGG